MFFDGNNVQRAASCGDRFASHLRVSAFICVPLRFQCQSTLNSVGLADSSHPTIAQHDINPTRLEADRYREVIKATLVAEELVHNVQADVVVRRALAGDALVYVLWTKPTEVVLIVWIGRIE
jgi:hypothetical protein